MKSGIFSMGWGFAIAAALGAWFALPGLGISLASALAIASQALALIALVGVSPDDDARRAAWLSGALAAATAFVSPPAWLLLSLTLTLTFVVVAQTHARGTLRRDALRTLGVGLGVPVLFGGALVIAGGGSMLEATLRVAMPIAPWELAAITLCRVIVVVVVLRPTEIRRPLQVCLAGGAIALLVARVLVIASYARVDGELFWPEAPMLVNALKLANHETLYGAPSALDSYSYSPLLDVVHRALLRPFGLELELFAHRALVLCDQLAALAIVLWALWPSLRSLSVSLRAASAAVLAFAFLSNLLAPAVHPDHPLLVCFAVAVALVIAGDRLPPRVRDVALVLVTPLATGFKLSGVGIGVGLAVIALLRRDKRSVVLLAISGVLTIATIPLFDAVFGRFSFYAIALQKSHPMEWRRLLDAPYLSFFAFGAAGLIALLVAREARSRALPLVVLVASMVLLSLPATAKYGGRENNLSLLVVGTTTLLVLLAAQAPRLAGALLGLALWGALLTRPPSRPLASDARRAIGAETAALAELVARDASAGERTLLLTTVLPWIRAGRTDVPRDRYHSAIELYFGQFPEGRLLVDRIAAGTYGTVVVSGDALMPRAGPARAFQAAVVESVERRYVETKSPTNSTPLPNARVFVRRSVP